MFKARNVAVGLLAVMGMSGCMGQMGLSKMLTEANLKAVDNRYGRAGVYMLLSPVYAFTATADLFVFNTIEFWTGKNPITRKGPAVVDTPIKSVIEVNPHLDPSLNRVPLASRSHVEKVDLSYPQPDRARMEVEYQDGRRAVMEGVRRDHYVDLYLDGRKMASLTREEMARYASDIAARQA
ncbi:DUF3332 domain-containing protein [Aeromonas schubertii]|uniref:DUF3332 domain-containing protein n=2 Tax=Aeromonas TaxID=642 RepID=A0ABS7VCB0_9GAMM|nr:DUF3332 domain-containing protein [Aeromonas schubertii]MBZ6066682.1 DUF3332 domain-containing protein [Aeromonas schubertii]MBZ6074294.1 DUF3332 domain-containing protein [Aeromonas schubertii]